MTADRVDAVALRPASMTDVKTVFEWRNDPLIVRLGSSQSTVQWAEHESWFAAKLADARCLMLIVESGGQPIGQVRFDLDAPGQAVISVYLVPAQVGRGLGVRAIRDGCLWAGRTLGVHRIVALVRRENLRGQRAFAKAGFETSEDKRCPADHVALAFDASRAVDDARNVQIYTSLAERFGHDVRALDWGSRESQSARFAVLAGVGDLRGRSVLDVGCGLGDFAGWLERNGVDMDYTGIDITPRMVDLARASRPSQRFEVGDLLSLPLPPEGRQWDFVVASGIFAKRQAEPDRYLRAAIERMFALCTAAVAFNVLSTWAPGTDGDEYHADPLQTLGFCRGLTPWVALRHDYHPRDFTVYLRREPRA